LIESNQKEFILRKPPIGAKVKSGHDMSREYKILSALKNNYKKSPIPIHYCDDINIIGSDFYIMERIKGIVLRSNNFKKILTKKTQYDFIAIEFIDTFVELHKLEIEKIGLGEFGRPVGYCERQVKGWTKRYQNSKSNYSVDTCSSLDQYYRNAGNYIPAFFLRTCQAIRHSHIIY